MKSILERMGKKVLNSVRSYLYDDAHKHEAMNAVRVIETHNGQSLSREIRKTADDYAADVFGSKRYAPWLYVYALVRGKFYEGWIPDNYFGRVVTPQVNKELVAITGFKSFSNRVLRTDAMPDIAYFIDGVLYDQDMSAINIHQLRQIVDREDDQVFVKKDHTGRGAGVMKLASQELTEDSFGKIGNCVMQALIKQHPFFDEIITGSVATTRITTVKELDGRIGLRAAYLRLGRKDTPWVQSDNSVRVAIVDQNGELDGFGYTQDWRRSSTHPDSGTSFANRRIPNFKEAVRLCTELHSKVPHFTILGWDVAVCDNEGIAIMEWNSNHCDIKFSEATTGPCFIGLNWERYRGK
jgi:hypothetical protein